jgi:hypothetical protein
VESQVVICVLLALFSVAGPVLLVVFWLSFREGEHKHPIYRRSHPADPSALEPKCRPLAFRQPPPPSCSRMPKREPSDLRHLPTGSD